MVQLLILLTLLRALLSFEIEKLYSFNETKISLNKNKNYIIFEFENDPKEIDFPDFSFTTKEELIYIIFETGNQINTQIDIYNNTDNITLEDNKFINSTYHKNLYGINKIWINGIQSGKFYIVISNFVNNIFEDTITIFNNMEYYDISKFEQFRYNVVFSSYSKHYLTFRIENINLKYSFFHFDAISYNSIYFKAVSGQKVQIYGKNSKYIYLKENQNDVIYILIYYYSYYNLDKTTVLFRFSNYGELNSLTNLENKVFDLPLINSHYIYLFLDIKDYPEKSYIFINSKTFKIWYYFFETNDFEIIETYIPLEKEGIVPYQYNIYNNIFYILEKQTIKIKV